MPDDPQTPLARFQIDPLAPQGAVIDAGANAIRAGGIVAIPTDTLYGLAVDPFNAAAIARLYRLKGREAERALPLIAADLDQIAATLGMLPMLARLLAIHFWPGPLTLLMPAPGRLPPQVTGGTGRVGVRVPGHAVARALCAACGTPLTATSANRTGEPPTNHPDEVARLLGHGIDVLLDAGVTSGGPPSTIVDATDEVPRVIRQGAIPWEQIQACLGL
jgi:L-threonylcarbamoyladenylate synthase